jgi:hypothetical protein
MTMDELFRELKDLDFKANKLLKSKVLDAEIVRQFNDQSLRLKQTLLELSPQDDVAAHVTEISEIDIDGTPNLRKFKKQKYFKKLVSKTKNQWIAIEFLLKS